jgi:hypothetical protein
LIWLAVNWDRKQAVVVMVMNLWFSQNSGKVLHQMRNCQLVKATGVCFDAVFHFPKSTASDITNCNAPSIIHHKSIGFSRTANMHIQLTSF